MGRPTILIIEVQPAEGLSVRKLVLETAGFNVLTGYSGAEGLELIERFPRVDAVVFHAGIDDVPCEELMRASKSRAPQAPVLYLTPHIAGTCPDADHVLTSHEPQQLMDLLEQIAGRPSINL